MTTNLATDPLLALQLKLPTHTYRAVKRRADEFKGDERTRYLAAILAQWERGEGSGRAA